MDKTFNELFDEFFKNKSSAKLSGDVNEQKIIDMLINSKNIENIDEEVEKQIDAELGKPDKIEFCNEGNIFFERRIWYTPKGDLIKLVISDEPTLISAPVKRNLQSELDKAVSDEDYVKAIAIRDEIKKLKKSQNKLGKTKNS